MGTVHIHIIYLWLNITSQNYVYSTDQPQPNTKEDPKNWPRVFFVSTGVRFLNKKLRLL